MKNVEIKTKKIKRICDVRGCKNTLTYAIVRGNEFTGSIFLCSDCIKDIYNMTFPIECEKVSTETTEEPQVEKTAQPEKEEPQETKPKRAKTKKKTEE